MASIEYFAGFFDGEGSVSVHLHQKNPKALVVNVSANQVDPRPLMLLKERYGGSLILCKNFAPSGKSGQIWRWQLVSAKAEPFLRDIFPHLIVKKHEVEIALQIRESMKRKLTLSNNKQQSAEILQTRTVLFNSYKAMRGTK